VLSIEEGGVPAQLLWGIHPRQIQHLEDKDFETINPFGIMDLDNRRLILPADLAARPTHPAFRLPLSVRYELCRAIQHFTAANDMERDPQELAREKHVLQAQMPSVSGLIPQMSVWNLPPQTITPESFRKQSCGCTGSSLPSNHQIEAHVKSAKANIVSDPAAAIREFNIILTREGGSGNLPEYRLCVCFPSSYL
jgi:hypothetical protein